MSSLHHKAFVGIGDEAVRVAGHNGQPHGSKHTISVDTQFMPANAGGGPSSVVQQHFKRDVVAVQTPIQGDGFEFVAVRIKEHRVEVKRTVSGHAASFTFKFDKGQSTGMNIEGHIGREHGSRCVVKPTPVKLPRAGRLGLNKRICHVVREFIGRTHAHGDVTVHHPSVALDIFSDQLQNNLLSSRGLPWFKLEGEVNRPPMQDIQFEHG